MMDGLIKRQVLRYSRAADQSTPTLDGRGPNANLNACGSEGTPALASWRHRRTSRPLNESELLDDMKAAQLAYNPGVAMKTRKVVPRDSTVPTQLLQNPHLAPRLPKNTRNVARFAECEGDTLEDEEVVEKYASERYLLEVLSSMVVLDDLVKAAPAHL